MIRVVVADDQALVRSGFSLILGAEPGIEVVAEAADGTRRARRGQDAPPRTSC